LFIDDDQKNFIAPILFSWSCAKRFAAELPLFSAVGSNGELGGYGR